MHGMDHNPGKILYFNYILAGICGLNMYIDLSLIMFGHNIIMKSVLSLDFVKVLAVLMGLCSLGMLVLARKFVFESSWQKLFYGLAFVYFAGGALFHGQVFLDQSNLYYVHYQKWIALMLLVFNSCFVYLFCNVKNK